MMKKRAIPLQLIILVLLYCQCESPNERKPYSWTLVPFVKVDSLNPILSPGSNSFVCPILQEEVFWEAKDVFNPAAVVRNGKVHLLYRAEDSVGTNHGTSRIGLAISEDGLNFEKEPTPVFYPENDSLKVLEWDGGVEDPRIVSTPDGGYLMTYTSYDGEVARLMLASSKDLRSWEKHGRVLKGPYKDTWSKAGAILVRQKGEELVAEKVVGKYWMYFGDTDIFLASSEDLIHWEPLVGENGELKSVLKPRPGFFDSRLVEPGPYALLRDEGILLLYNGMNLDGEGMDTALAPGAYSAGQALFDWESPDLLIDRMQDFFMTPEKDYEIEGQINLVCFIEGMVPFQGKWFLYYGTADSKIAVAVHE